ncbi:hypothetical protein MTZ49_02050 [Entomomonas sp. E2T0]|uniref:hypothetical protein n=1 Tax=Entomomonas sp. E2T0 TaxID=2930213 RepID=UPI00222839E8|nr:hypothetical protein [Entomomonas sp. E2T0]UYZ84387.1 hypothetical protein MTZ49_02050 [Entomomonas sp. E2T0]
MSKATNISPCFIPLNFTSQSNKENVLYYNANAAAEDIFECATGRLLAVINLLESLYEFDKCESTAVQAVCSASSLLLNDAFTLLQEMNPVATRLRNENKKD